MSLHRVNPKSGKAQSSSLLRGANGRYLCRQCSTEVPKGRRTFCQDACVHDWKLRSNPGYLRMQVYSRDQGVCAVCKTDCHKLEQTRTRYRKDGYLAWQQYCQELNQQGFSGADHASLWQADHIVAVKDGGGECGLDNLQTLCTSCHQRKTTEMRKRHAKTKAVDL